jgi:PhzF family phenazine biosynthesis protein
MGIAIYQVDAFTEKSFRGNPAAVCILLEPGEEAWVQNVARKINPSETTVMLIARTREKHC